MAKTFYIIDGHAHIYAAYYAPMRPLNSPSGEPTKAVYVFTTAVLGLLERNKPDMLIVAMDSKTPTFRTKIFPEYKAHRPPMPDDMPGQILRIEQILNAMRIPIVRINGFEADDIIGTLAAKAAAQGFQTYICSKDKDMLQLVDDKTFTYDIKTGEKIDPAAMLRGMKIKPEQFVDVLALQGDKVDNVPGVADVGPKTALEWIRKYGSIDNLYAHAAEITGKRGDNLRSSRELVLLSRELVTISRDVPVEFDQRAFSVTEPDRQKLSAVFTELGFTRLLGQLNLSDQPPAAEKKEAPGGMLFPEPTAEVSKPEGKRYELIDTEEKFEMFFEQLRKQKIFAVDTETTSIDPMRADLVGISFSWKVNEGFYLPVKAPLGQAYFKLEKVREKIGPVLENETIKKIGQNIKYDLMVLENAQMPLKGIYFDTMVASYCLDSDRVSHSLDAMARDFLGYETMPISALIGKGKNQLTFDMVDTASACRYSAEDADVTFGLYEYLSARLEKQPDLKKLFEQVEMPLVEVLAAMESAGVSLDVHILKKMNVELSQTLEQLIAQIYQTAGTVFNIDSPKQIAEVLFDRLGLASVRSGKTMRSTDAEVLEQLAAEHEIVPLILQYRQIVKLKNTYTDKLGRLINPRTGRVHASFNQTVTATGRLSSSEPNLQNIPIKTELGRRIRSAFIPAPKNWCILSADYSQIELRMLSHFSQDSQLKKAFDADQDIHRFVASQIYGVSPEDVTQQMRSNCKAVNFGIIYGQGAYGLSRTIGINQAEAKKFIEDYFARYGSIRAFMDETIAQARRKGYAETILGRRRTITGLGGKNSMKRSQAERLAVNTVIQGSAADLIKVAMINIHRRLKREKSAAKMILQIHDELVFELPEKDADAHAAWIAEEMTNAINLDVPLKVDISIGPSWLAEK